jgi:2-deoxy-D-gluconate 3-dehydrogenase
MGEASVEHPLFQLEDKVALVVGGGQGMGESITLLLARAGCDVAVLDIAPERAEGVAGAVRALGRRSAAITADVLDPTQVPGAVTAVERELGGPDILVTVVGGATYKLLLDLTPEDWEADLRRNLSHFFFIGREVAASLIRRERPGAMVCIASVAGLQSSPVHAAYGAAKAGLVNLVRTMAMEWGPHGIRVNAIAPGGIVTPTFPETAEARARERQGPVPLRRRGTTDEIAKAALFLVSDLASYVTGETLAVDGGWMATFLASVDDLSRLRNA